MNHQDIDRRSLMMHRIIAARLRALRLTDRVAVTHSSRGLQPTGSGAGRLCRVATLQSRSQLGSGDGFAVSLRDTELLDNWVRGLKPTATVRHHYVVEQMPQRRVDILSTGLTECPPSLGRAHLSAGLQRSYLTPHAFNRNAELSPLTAGL